MSNETLQRVEFEVDESLSLQNSYGTIRNQKDVKLHVTIGINSDTYGWFELYDIETGGDDWYAEGGLWIENNVITDYDGVFSLPYFIIEKLEEMGYDISHVEVD